LEAILCEELLSAGETLLLLGDEGVGQGQKLLQLACLASHTTTLIIHLPLHQRDEEKSLQFPK